MKRIVLPLVASALFLLAACDGNTSKKDGDTSTNDGDTPEKTDKYPWEAEPDTTLRLRAEGFGMGGTCAFVDEKGEIFEYRLPEDRKGIHGTRREGDRYALTLMPDSVTLRTLINLSQLERGMQPYETYNGRVVTKNTEGNLMQVEIEVLNDTLFSGRMSIGGTYTSVLRPR